MALPPEAICLMNLHGDQNPDRCPFSPVASKGHTPPENHSAFAHSDETKRLGIPRLAFRDAPPVVLYFQQESAVAFAQPYLD